MGVGKKKREIDFPLWKCWVAKSLGALGLAPKRLPLQVGEWKNCLAGPSVLLIILGGGP